MVQRILSVLNREFNNINQAAFVLASFTLLGQLIAILRDRSLAHFLGPSETLDAYYVAFRIPDFLFLSVASLVSVNILLPFLVDKIGHKENGHLNHTSEKARAFFNNVFTVFITGMIAVSVIVFIFMPVLAKLVAPGFSAELQKELVMLSRIMLLSPIFLGLSNLMGSITQLFKKFFVFALTPVFYNIGGLLGILVFYPLLGVNGLALGIVVGAIMHFLIQVPVVARHKFIPRFSFSINWSEIRKMMALSIPRTIGLSINGIALIAIIAFASLISEGSISVFNLSFNLHAVPLALIGVSYSVAAFPTLAQLYSANHMKDFLRQISIAARQIVFWSIPVMFLFIVLRAQIVRTILGSGAFTWDDTRLTAASLALFAIAIFARGLILLFIRGYYAAGQTRRPVIISVISAGIIIVLSYVLLKVFHAVPVFQYFIESILRVDGIPGTGILMLSFAYALGTIIHFGMLWRAFKKDFPEAKEVIALKKTFFQVLGASFFIGFAAYQMLPILDNVFDINTFWGILMQGLIAGIVGIIVGIGVLKLMKNEQLKEVQQTLKSRFWKFKEVIAPSQEDL